MAIFVRGHNRNGRSVHGYYRGKRTAQPGSRRKQSVLVRTRRLASLESRAWAAVQGRTVRGAVDTSPRGRQLIRRFLSVQAAHKSSKQKLEGLKLWGRYAKKFNR